MQGDNGDTLLKEIKEEIDVLKDITRRIREENNGPSTTQLLTTAQRSRETISILMQQLRMTADSLNAISQYKPHQRAKMTSEKRKAKKKKKKEEKKLEELVTQEWMVARKKASDAKLEEAKRKNREAQIQKQRRIDKKRLAERRIVLMKLEELRYVRAIKSGLTIDPQSDPPPLPFIIQQTIQKREETRGEEERGEDRPDSHYFDRFMEDETTREVQKGIQYPPPNVSIHKKTVERFYGQHMDSVSQLVTLRRVWDSFLVAPGTPSASRIPDQDMVKVADRSHSYSRLSKSFIICLSLVALAVAQIAYPNNPECGWGDQTYHAVGDWATDAGSSSNWDPAESKGVMTPTYAQPCEYKATVTGLVPGKSYQWKVTIGGTWNNNWGCNGQFAANCNFQADPSGGIVFKIVASYAYPLTTESTNNNPTPNPTPTNNPTPPPPNNSGKYVFAHYMMGYAYGSDQAFFQKASQMAQGVGVDAFACNVGKNDWQPDRFQKFLDGAASVGFKLFLSFDMNEIDNDVSVLDNYVNKFVDHPAYFRYNGRPFVSTFAGQDKNLGIGGSGNDAWNKWKTQHVGGKNIFFCPNFFGDLAGNYNQYPVIDCLFSWDAWGSSSSNGRDVPAINTAHSQGKQYMTGVAPWFYCHLPQWGKNWFWPQGTSQGDSNIYSTRWSQAIQSGSDFVEIITWNDYSESSYIAPLTQEVPDFAHAYVDGMDHGGWYGMTAYYANWFKTGQSQPSKNSLYWSYRIHGRDQGRNDQYPKPTLFWTPGDCVGVHSIAANTGASVNVNIGGRDNWHNVNSTTSSWCVPFNGVGAVRVSVKLNGQTTNSPYNGPDIQGDGNTYNFNEWSVSKGQIRYRIEQKERSRKPSSMRISLFFALTIVLVSAGLNLPTKYSMDVINNKKTIAHFASTGEILSMVDKSKPEDFTFVWFKSNNSAYVWSEKSKCSYYDTNTRYAKEDPINWANEHNQLVSVCNSGLRVGRLYEIDYQSVKTKMCVALDGKTPYWETNKDHLDETFTYSNFKANSTELDNFHLSSDCFIKH
ncbi:hypothetical protein PROFUN_03569 [Planoprotostelium fungivorum]|uniref:Amylopullulanase X25 domain-containing protein n=1 Tax=Planoprotostelium fungivorum TaxID=1890364 RepID=A0A2P6MSI5_9EUKA|nr:hypothetical protein PROFUN_03569 [Planoprotostelium fungivorum]